MNLGTEGIPVEERVAMTEAMRDQYLRAAFGLHLEYVALTAQKPALEEVEHFESEMHRISTTRDNALRSVEALQGVIRKLEEADCGDPQV